MKIKPATKRLLVRRLAAMEAPWAPIRGHEWEAMAGPSICAARRNGGVTIWGTAGDRRQRVTDTRCRAEAAKAGLLRRGGGLTVKGKAVVRGWRWPFSMDDLTEALIRLCDAVERGDYMPTRGLVPEELLCGEVWGDQTSMLQYMLTPLLADGALAARSTYTGWAFYRIEHSNISSILPTFIAAEHDDQLSDLFAADFRRCREALVSDKNRPQEIGEFPVVIERLKSGRNDHDITGIPPLFNFAATTTTGGAVDG